MREETIVYCDDYIYGKWVNILHTLTCITATDGPLKSFWTNWREGYLMDKDRQRERKVLLHQITSLYDNNCENCKLKLKSNKICKQRGCKIPYELEKLHMQLSLADAERRFQKGLIEVNDCNVSDTTIDYLFLELYRQYDGRMRKTLQEFRKKYSFPQVRVQRSVARLKRIGMVGKEV